MGISPGGVKLPLRARGAGRRRGLPALVAGLSLVAALGGPLAATAFAAAPPGAVVEFLPPTPDAGVPLQGVQRLKIRAAVRLGVVSGLHLAVRSDDPSIPPYEWHIIQPLAFQEGMIEVDWNTTMLTHNGVFRLDAKADVCRAGDCGLVEASRTGLLVANPPEIPANVRAAFHQTVPVVTWDAGAAADLLGYRVLRYTGEAFLPVGSVRVGEPTVFADHEAPFGVGLSYAVVAVRRSPVAAPGDACQFFDANCVASEPSPGTPFILIPGQPTPGDAGGPGGTLTGGQDSSVPVPGSTVDAPPRGTDPLLAENPPAAGAEGLTAGSSPTGGSSPSTAARQLRRGSRAGGAAARPELQKSEPPTEVLSNVETRELSPPPRTEEKIISSFPRVRSSPDRTVTLVVFTLLALGLFGARKATRLLWPNR